VSGVLGQHFSARDEVFQILDMLLMMPIASERRVREPTGHVDDALEIASRDRSRVLCLATIFSHSGFVASSAIPSAISQSLACRIKAPLPPLHGFELGL